METVSSPKHRGTPILALVLAITTILGTISTATMATAATTQVRLPGLTITGSQTGPWYTVALGASLARGTGATQQSLDYVNRVATAESRIYPGLVVKNVSCGGDTVSALLRGDRCRPAGQTQLGNALAILRSHPGHIAYITIDIGADEVLPCISGTTVKLTCVASALAEIRQNLPTVLTALQTAARGVPIVGAVYYDPELYRWLLGPQGRAAALQFPRLLAILNSTLESIYASSGIPVANWQAAFYAQDSSQQATWQGVQVPVNVARTCEWTHECDTGHLGQNVHANDAGYGVLAATIENVLTQLRQDASMPGRSWLAAADGGVFAFGSARFFGSMGTKPLNAPIVGIAAAPNGNGYWLAAADGGVFAFVSARFFGSMGAKPLNAPIVGIAATPNGNGYWLTAADGGVFAFGSAAFFGSAARISLTKHVVAIVASPDGAGYWLVASDGGVFTYGDAAFFGSLGSRPLNLPIVAAHVTPDGNGYWLVASDGGVFAFGDAQYYGSSAGLKLTSPISAFLATLSGNGYRLIASDGGDFAYGGAHFSGSLAGRRLNAPIVAAATP